MEYEVYENSENWVDITTLGDLTRGKRTYKEKYTGEIREVPYSYEE